MIDGNNLYASINYFLFLKIIIFCSLNYYFLNYKMLCQIRDYFY